MQQDVEGQYSDIDAEEELKDTVLQHPSSVENYGHLRVVPPTFLR
jgi:hypothetical protein